MLSEIPLTAYAAGPTPVTAMQGPDDERGTDPKPTNTYKIKNWERLTNNALR